MSNAALELSNALAEAVDGALTGVVRVEGGRRRPASGVVWGPDLVITAAHAVEREEGIEIGLEGGQRVAAGLAGRDPATGLALLRIEHGTLPALARKPAVALRRGQLVLALSRPGRTLRARAGILSVLSDGWRTPHGASVEHYVQSDIAPEPGFSGGALIDVAGNFVGMNNAGLLRGTPLALGAATVDRLVQELLADGRVRRGFLGVSSHPVRLPSEPAERMGRNFGLIVVAVQPAGPAERAGLLLGDVLLTLDREALESIEDLQAALEQRSDKAATLTLLRAGKELTLTVTPGARG